MILACKSLRGILYVEVLLEKFKTIKELFIHEVEDGIETFIPKDLSQDHLPMSFRYYDPVIAVVSEHVSHLKRENLTLKQKVAHKLHFEGDIGRLVLEKTGVYTPKANEPLVFKYTALNKKPPTGVNHHNSHHTMALQRSKYICLDDNIGKEFVLENQSKKKLKEKQ